MGKSKANSEGAVQDGASSRSSTAAAAGGAQSVARAIAILKAFTHADHLLSLAEVARRAGLTKPTAHRLLNALATEKFVSKRGEHYRLGSEIMALAALRANQADLIEVAMPVIRRIRDKLGETISIAGRVGDERVLLYQLDGLHALRRGGYAGERTPLYCGASNKLLLAGMEDQEISDYLERVVLKAFTPATITDKSALWEEIRRIRIQDWAESLGEKFVGGASVATPIRDAFGRMVAALFVSLPKERYTDDTRQLCIDLLKKGSAEISDELGYRPAAK